MKVVHCPCGVDVRGESDETGENVEAHIAKDHPEMVGKYSREQILEMADAHRKRTGRPGHRVLRPPGRSPCPASSNRAASREEKGWEGRALTGCSGPLR